jgi:hypothetical protein
MGGWYWIGVCAGLGAGAGVLLAGLVGATRAALLVAGALALAAGAGLGYAIESWQPGGWGDLLAGVLGGLGGALGAARSGSAHPPPRARALRRAAHARS